jgi:chemotaxis protein histidine kinase CheA
MSSNENNNSIDFSQFSNRDLCSLASLYHRAEKYDLIINVSKYFLSQKKFLEQEEFNVLIEGYKCLLNTERKKLIKLLDIQHKEKKRNSSHYKLINQLFLPHYNKYISICNDFLEQIESQKNYAKNFESIVFINKLKCDFIRYKAQFIMNKETKEKLIKTFFEIVNESENLSAKYLDKFNENYLLLELGKCVFYYEICNDKEKAMNNVKELLDKLNKNEEDENKNENEKKEENKIEEEKNEEKKEEKVEEKKDDKNKEKKPEEKKTEEKKNEVKNDEENKENEEQKNEEEKKEEDQKNIVKNYNYKITMENLPPNIKEIIRLLKTNYILWSGKSEDEIRI